MNEASDSNILEFMFKRIKIVIILLLLSTSIILNFGLHRRMKKNSDKMSHMQSQIDSLSQELFIENTNVTRYEIIIERLSPKSQKEVDLIMQTIE